MKSERSHIRTDVTKVRAAVVLLPDGARGGSTDARDARLDELDDELRDAARALRDGALSS